MSDREPTPTTSRRGFLRRVLASIGGLIVANAGQASAHDGAPVQDDSDHHPASSGYRETEHIRAYYDSARF